jgi:5-methylcytosine-specific restriction protein A
MTDISTTPRKHLSPTQRLRLFEAHKGICGICGREIRSGQRWIVEHMRALSLGGTNEPENLRPVHTACADAKTHGRDGDLAKAAKAKRSKMASLGIKRDGPKIHSPGFPKKQERVGKIDKSALPTLPRKGLYR